MSVSIQVDYNFWEVQVKMHLSRINHKNILVKCKKYKLSSIKVDCDETAATCWHMLHQMAKHIMLVTLHRFLERNDHLTSQQLPRIYLNGQEQFIDFEDLESLIVEKIRKDLE
jgi:hypothetical protein